MVNPGKYNVTVFNHIRLKCSQDGPMPRHARGARFDQGSKRVQCTKDTRIEILHRIYHWFDGKIQESDEVLTVKGNVQGRIFWLDGVAGTGKSTIAQTVAHHYHKTKQLGATFFCSRDDAECSNVNVIFPTIAYQLALFNSTFKKHVSDAMRKDPDLQSALTSMQLEKLIVDPLQAMGHNQAFPPCLIIIDALDECKEENATSTILLALSMFADRLSPLKLFITSRPVTSVEQGFRTTGLMKDTSTLVLHSIPWDISQKDIRIYLEGRCLGITRSFPLPPSWPSKGDLARLVELSQGLFIFAATTANFIEDRNANDPQHQLTTLLPTKYVASSDASPYRQLDTLYLQVLREAFPNISGRQRARLKTVQGTVVLLFDPLDPDGLEVLLGLEENTVRLTFRSLHSITIVPDAGDGGPVQLLHPSFHDFLIDLNRCYDHDFVINAQLQHTLLAECCLRVLQTLSPDMCEIRDPSLYNSEVSDLANRIAAHIPPHVQYACRHWASHLMNGDTHDKILDLLQGFCSDQMMNWLEVMSLLGQLESAIIGLLSTHRIVKVRHL